VLGTEVGRERAVWSALPSVPAVRTGRIHFLNGDHLVVLWSVWLRLGGYGYGWTPLTFLHVYDASTPEIPTLWENITLSGLYVGARMIGDYVYLIGRSSPYGPDGNLSLPGIWQDGERTDLTYADVAYFPDSAGSRELAVVLAVNVRTGGPPGHEAFLAPNASQVYMSARNLYLATAASWTAWWGWDSGTETTTIHKVAISGGSVCFVATGTVRGTILNQFSMDEHRGYLRVATTTGQPRDGSSRNHIYALNGTLVQVGRLEDLAPGERVYSARFMGDRAYLVTFKKVDPLFVLDLSDPAKPAVLGYLKIPGYSSYLHPYDATHVIGLGKDAVDMGDFAWFQGIKVSLFDVTDVEHPQEVSQLLIGDRGTDSDALWDHKAFLFIPSRGLLVLPVNVYEIDRRANPNPPPNAYGQLAWQGAYAVSVTLDTGLGVAAKIAHNADPASCRTNYGSSCSRYTVHRSLYIDRVLYTVSAAFVKMNDLDTFQDLGTIPL